MPLLRNRGIESGLSLIELIVVMAIIAVVAAFAYPSYLEQVRKSRRAQAHEALTDLAQQQERFHTVNLSYADGLDDLNHTDPTFYVVTLAAQDATATACNGTAADRCVSYVLTATPRAGQEADTCATITLSHIGARGPNVECW